jgi:diguanylate cyclase (GGDEF)-like protein
MNFSKYLLLLLVILFLNLNILANDKVVLQLSWKHQFAFAGYYMAKAMGYYNDAGIDIELKEVKFGEDVSTSIENRNVDFAIGRSSLLIDKSNGKDIVALGAIFQHSPLMLLVRADTNINSVKDLKNKNIMITSEAKLTASIVAMLNANGIEIRDVKIQNHSFDLDDLINKKTDAMASYISNEPIKLTDRNIDYKIFHPKDYGFDFYSDILFTSSTFLKENPKLTKDFFDATVKGWQYAFNHIGISAKVIFDKYNTQNNSLIHYVSEGEALKKLAFHTGTNQIGCLSRDKLEKIVDIYKVMGFIKDDVNLDEFIYEHNNHDVLKMNFSHNELYLYIVIALLIIFGLISLIFYFTIKKKWLHTNSTLEEEIIAKTSQIKKMTYIDSLTNIKNRRAYDEKISELLSLYERYEESFSIAMFDIDDFKKINDTYGHHIGDIVLQDLSKLVKSQIRRNDYLYRVGGEEFVIIFHNRKFSNIPLAAQKIVKKVDLNLMALKKETITISMGLTTVIKSDTIDSIYERVDGLLYKAKKSGKNKLCY